MVAPVLASPGRHGASLPLHTGRLTALVLGTNYRALGVVRSLGRHGVASWVVKQDSHALASRSRHAERTLPWPKGDDAGKVEYLKLVASSNSIRQFLLIPTDDECTTLVSKWHDHLEADFVLTTPAWESLQWACDKRMMYQLGEQLGIDQPRTSFPGLGQGLNSGEFRFPVILKPAIRSVLNPLALDKAWRIDDRSMLIKRYAEACGFMSPDLLMVQELIPGEGESQYSYAALCMEGRPLASLVAVRVRQFPMDFGRFSTFVETVDEPAVEEAATKVIQAIGFTGLVEVEFKRDPRDGRYKLLDINPRVWGWHSMCAAAGVDFPYLLLQMMEGQPLPSLRARTGVRWARMGFDFTVAMSEICKGNLSIFEYVKRLRPPLETSIFALDDPLPALCEPFALARLLWRRARKQLRITQSVD